MLGVPRDQQKKQECIQMQLQSDGVRWEITDWEGDTQCEHDVNLIREATKQTGWTFAPHPLTAISPWHIHPGTEPRSVAKVIDNQRTLRIYAPMRRGLDGIVDKLQRIAESDDWFEHVQFRQSNDIWNQKGCLTPYQLWTTYRISTLQLNLYHRGRMVSSACPSNAGCRDTKETVSHIVWTCKRAQAIWTFFFERWIGTKMSEARLPIFLPHIASRTPPATKRSLWRRLETQYGFVTEDHEKAMRVIWFMMTTCIPVLLWRTRNDIVHNADSITVEDSTKHIWDACRMQIRAVAKRKGVKRGKKIAALCTLQVLSILEHGEPLDRSMNWTTARLYFDGGARGNPGPGGSGWALLLFHDSTKTWQLKACGYMYMGQRQSRFQTLPRKYWGGNDELRMTALALDRSIYGLDVQTDGATYLVQYTPVRTFCDSTEDWTTEMRILRDGAATTTFCEEMRHHPRILLCRRGASEASHFTPLRSGILRTETSNETANADYASANISVQGSNRLPVTSVEGTEVGNSPALLPLPQQETLNRRRETLLRRMVGTRAEIATLTKAELVIRKLSSFKFRQAHGIVGLEVEAKLVISHLR